ncbi:hypothetical protein [Salmonella phage SD-2_S15]|nr:hypothetical protein [Salmonella phage SD-2_S15]WPK18995.1 hypothetical protein [Salmonella phage SD-6_S16]WPK20690.1 hypothetical protein [Salmonella phage SD-15_S21]
MFKTDDRCYKNRDREKQSNPLSSRKRIRDMNYVKATSVKLFCSFPCGGMKYAQANPVNIN